MDRRKFIKNSIVAGTGCILCSAFFAGHYISKETTNNNIDFDSKFKGLDIIPNIDIHLAEHCNLNCKYCSHFSPIAEKEFLDVEQYSKDIKQFAKVTEQRVRHIFLLGGEPLLHPQVEKVCELTRNAFPLSDIELLTNGILINSMPESFWKTLNKFSITLRRTVYPIKIDNVEEHVNKAEKYDVIFVTEPPIDENHFPVMVFFRQNIDIKGNIDFKQRFYDCTHTLRADWSCSQLYKGKLYECHIMQGIRHFNKKFGTHIPVTDADVLDIYKAKNYNDIIEYKNRVVEFCKYCDYSDDMKPWEQAKEHDITEWTCHADELA